jgi:hypothetical protein
MRSRETAEDKRLRRSIETKTSYLIRISQEQAILRQQDEMISRLEALQAQTAQRVKDKSVRIYEKLQQGSRLTGSVQSSHT